MPSMLFGLFSRKQDHPMDTQSLSSVDSRSTEPVQLRTPSPSVESTMNAAGPSTPPMSSASNDRNRPMSPLRNSLSQMVVRSDTTSPDSIQALHQLVSAVPAKTLHSYTLTQIRHALPSTVAALTSFYSDLHPPPKLHCVRCHNEYVEIENDDRSCLIAHDDETALVERVGRAIKGRDAESSADYETLWQCCGKTVEGNGDQGPPDGWCYEGKHTTDVKRARFRADSTPHNDKLISCIRKNCGGTRIPIPKVMSTRHKRTRSLKDAADTPEYDTSGDESRMDLDGSASVTGSVRGRTKRKAVPKPTEGRAKSTDMRPTSKPRSTRRAASASAKPKSRIRQSTTKHVGDESVGGEAEDKPKKRRKVV